MSKRTTEIVVAEDTNQPPPPPPPKQPQLQLPNIQLPNLLSSIHNFKFRFPPFLIPPKPKRADSPNNNNVAVSDADDHVADAASGGGRSKRNVVRFPKAQVVAVPPPRLEVEAEESTTKTSNPFILWQVYAIGLFFVAKWAHSRWNERKGRGKSPNDDDRDE